MRHGIRIIVLAFWFSGSAIAVQTQQALDIAEKWQSGGVPPIMGDDGRVLFTYGLSQPHIVCAPLKLCDIALQPGELVNDIKVGDQARWVLSGAVVGTDDNRIEHIIVKPKQAGLENTLFIATSKRGYLIKLSSHTKDNMGKVGFLYGEAETEYGTSKKGQSPSLASTRSVSNGDNRVGNNVQTTVSVDVVSDRDILGSNLNFNYKITGSSVPWRPIRVYDDGIKTFIDFDIKKIQGRELPVLMVYDTNTLGAIINYRVQRGRYIIDGLFEQAGLVLGVGKKQTKVNVERVSRRSAIDQPYE